ncbi:MAG: P-loop NTPase [Spirochaetales bacterium]|nr:P-loop NTPase [Spirochaetales bacterium]
MGKELEVGTKVIPHNFGPLKGANGNARLQGEEREMVEFWLRFEESKIVEASFISDGDNLEAISALAERVVGLSLEEAQKVDQEDLPLALQALKEALTNLEINLLKGVKRQIKPALEEVKAPKERRTLMVMSGKGGVGKSTVAVNLAISLAKQGLRVGLVDVDIHGPSIPTMLNLPDVTVMQAADGIQPVILGDLYDLEVMSLGFLLENADDPVVWRGPLKNSLISQFLNEVAWGPLDYLIVDLPPGTGDEPLSVAQQLSGKAEGLLVTTPQAVATVDVARSVNFCRQMKIPVAGIVENMAGFVCPHCHTTTAIFRSGGGKSLADHYHLPFLGSIPIDPSMGVAGDAGIPFVQRFEESPIAEIYSEIAKRLNETRSVEL